jgi:hypothetical protein
MQLPVIFVGLPCNQKPPLASAVRIDESRSERDANMRLQDKRVAVFIEQEFEDLEYWVPVMRLQEEGADVTTIGTGSSSSYRGKHGLTAEPDVTVDKVSASDLTALSFPAVGVLISSAAMTPFSTLSGTRIAQAKSWLQSVTEAGY